MNPTDTITKLRKLTIANSATPEEEKRAAEKIGRLLMAHPDISVGGVRESAPAAGRASARATAWAHSSFNMDDLRKMQEDLLRREGEMSKDDLTAAFRAELKRRMEEVVRERMKNGNPPEGWDSWIRARARTYE